jgi:hypothetical protein
MTLEFRPTLCGKNLMTASTRNRHTGRRQLWKWRLSLRWTLILFTLTSIIVGFVVHARRWTIPQQAVVDNLRQKWGAVAYDYELAFLGTEAGKRLVIEGRDPFRYAPPSGWAIFRWILGRDYFNNPISVDVHLENAFHPTFDASDWRDITSLRTVESLGLSHCDFPPDIEFSRLANLQRLKGLYLEGSTVSQEFINAVSQLPDMERINFTAVRFSEPIDLDGWSRLGKLETLHLSDMQLNELDLTPLAKLPSLRWLDLSKSTVTDEGIAWLSQTQLVRLELDQTRITGKCLQALPQTLTRLELSNTTIIDSDLQFLSHLKNLEDLFLAEVSLDGSGLIHLKSLPKLSHLSLYDNDIDEEMLDVLEEFPALESVSLSQELAHTERFARLREHLERRREVTTRISNGKSN